jgi:hypothetical protein
MARYNYMCIESRITWDSILNTTFPDLLYDEFLFWLENIIKINFKKLYFYSKSTAIVFSDASNVARGAYTIDIDHNIFHQMWNDFETSKSSTWREMKAIEQALLTFSSVRPPHFINKMKK